MHRLLILVVAAMAAILPGHAALAQTAPISLQGRLSGVPDGERAFVVTIWDSEVGGEAVATAAANATVRDGVFALDVELPAGAFPGLPRWWSVEVDGAATDRLRLGSVPQALSAATLGGGAAEAFEGDIFLNRNLQIVHRNGGTGIRFNSTEAGGNKSAIGWFDAFGDAVWRLLVDEDGDGTNDLRLRSGPSAEVVLEPGGNVHLFNDNGGEGIFFNSRLQDGNKSGLYWRAASGENIWRMIVDQDADGANDLRFRSSTAGSVLTITPNGRVGINNLTPAVDLDVDGRARVRSIIIRGGSDLAEPFPAAPAAIQPRPGMVLSIDPQTPGALRVSTEAYDTTVAGVYSGGNGLPTGMLMGKDGCDLTKSGEDRLPLAMTGRVWVYADDSGGEIRPGDRLTTSGTNPGFAARVDDDARAPGSVIGKAMTGIDETTGMVLVLVNLQ